MSSTKQEKGMGPPFEAPVAVDTMVHLRRRDRRRPWCTGKDCAKPSPLPYMAAVPLIEAVEAEVES